METGIAIGFVGMLVFVAHFFSAVFAKTRIPDILWLFVIGLLLGPVSGLLTTDVFGELGRVFTSITLVFILFDSGLGLRISDVRDSAASAVKLTILSFVFTTAGVAGVAVVFMRFELLQALLLGSILGGTSSAFVSSILRNLVVREQTSATLLLESTLSDVLTLPVPLMLLQIYALGSLQPGAVAGTILASFLLSGVIGGGGAIAWSALLNKVRNLENAMFTTPAFVFMLYGLAEFFGYSGPIAALAFGITLGNIGTLKGGLLRSVVRLGPVALNNSEKIFFAEIVFLLRTFFFVYIGLAVQLTNWWLVSIGLLVTVLLYLVRIPAVHLSLPSSTTVREASLAAALRATGLGSAVMASLPLQRGIPSGDLIQIIAFSVILFTTVLSTLFVFMIERNIGARYFRWFFLGYAEQEQPGKS